MPERRMTLFSIPCRERRTGEGTLSSESLRSVGLQSLCLTDSVHCWALDSSLRCRARAICVGHQRVVELES